MKLSYYSSEDMLYISLFDRPSADSHEVAPGIVFDYDAENVVVGIEIEDGARLADLSKLDVSGFPLSDLAFTGEAASAKEGVA